jgi:hypothetical protein
VSPKPAHIAAQNVQLQVLRDRTERRFMCAFAGPRTDLFLAGGEHDLPEVEVAAEDLVAVYEIRAGDGYAPPFNDGRLSGAHRASRSTAPPSASCSQSQPWRC